MGNMERELNFSSWNYEDEEKNWVKNQTFQNKPKKFIKTKVKVIKRKRKKLKIYLKK